VDEWILEIFQLWVIQPRVEGLFRGKSLFGRLVGGELGGTHDGYATLLENKIIQQGKQNIDKNSQLSPKKLEERLVNQAEAIVENQLLHHQLHPHDFHRVQKTLHQADRSGLPEKLESKEHSQQHPPKEH